MYLRWDRVLLGTLAALVLFSPLGWADSTTPASYSSKIQADPLKELQAIRRTGEFKLDGLLEEKFWQEAPVANGFRQSWPSEGHAASESTWVKIAYDDEALYVGIICFDSKPHGIRKRLTRRDRSTEADFVQVCIDSYHDRQTGYAFAVNASGVQRDLYIYNNDWTDDKWDAVWQSKVRMVPSGWTVEMRIPYHCLRFPESAEQQWGIDFIRYISRNDETTRWEFVPRAQAAGVSRYGVLNGIGDVRPPRHLEVLPYTTSKLKTDPRTLGNPKGRSDLQDFGGDIKWAISPNTVLDATVNPDFGQIEADGTVLNLSRFETRFPEKRPFFLEGLQLFDTDYSLFYSRRIGASPRYPDSLQSDDYLISLPEAATILYAGKLSGKTKGGVSYSMVNAVTSDEHAAYFGISDAGDTLKYRERVAERGVANITRVRKDILGNSSVGLMMTALNKDHHNPAYAGGADWNLKTKHGTYGTRGQVVTASPSVGAPGWGTTVVFEKYSGKHLLGNFAVEHEDRALNINDLGYLQRNDYSGGWGWMQYRTEKSLGPISRTWNNFNWWYGWNTAGQRLQLGGNWNGQIQFKNLWWLGGGHARDAARTDDREIGDGVGVRLPSGWDKWVWAETDYRKPISGNVNYAWGTSRDGHYNNYDLFMTIRPATNVEFSFGPGYGITWGASRYVATVDPSGSTPGGYLFAEQTSEQYYMTIRGIATFTTNLSIQFYGQPFLANVTHDNYKFLTGSNQYTPAPDQSLDGTDDDPDFSLLSFNANVVLRWEYRPGSTLFLVWSQARDDFNELPDFTFNHGLTNLFDLGSHNVFMIKMNYWWNL